MTQSGVALMDHDRGKAATDWRTSTTYFMHTRVRGREGLRKGKGGDRGVAPHLLSPPPPSPPPPPPSWVFMVVIIKHGRTCVCCVRYGPPTTQGHHVLQGIDQRVADLTRQPIEHQEHVQVLRYEETQRWVGRLA